MAKVTKGGERGEGGVGAKPATDEVVEEEESEAVTEMILLLPDGAWAWVVVACAFACMLIIDGVIMTYGVLISEIVDSFHTTYALAGLISAVQIAFYYMWSPLASALIHRIGIRATTMTGSCICSLGVFLSYFCDKYITFFLCYGVICGFGSSLINMPCMMIPEFYFEKFRAMTQAITLAGSSFGVMIFATSYRALDDLDNWRTTLLMKTSLLAMVYFFAYTFRSLRMLSKTGDHWETTGGDDEEGTAGLSAEAAKELGRDLGDSKPEAGMGAKAAVKHVTATAHVPSGVGRQQLARIASSLSNPSNRTKKRKRVSIYVETNAPQSTKTDKTDDYDYDYYEEEEEEEEEYETNQEKLRGVEAKLETFIKRKSKRARRAVKKVLTNMLDRSLLKWPSFLCLILCSIFSSFGILLPYNYLPLRSHAHGISRIHYDRFVSVIGASNALGRLILGGAQLGEKWDPTLIYSITLGLAGVATLMSDMSFDLLFQYGYAAIFGFFVSGQSAVRTNVVIKLYGLEKLTHGMGTLHVGLGIGSFTGQTMGGLTADRYGYKPLFVMSGVSMLAAAVTMIIVRIMSFGEEHQRKKEEAKAKLRRMRPFKKANYK